MQTPAGYEIVDGEFHARSWLEVIFNPSFPYRFAHMLLASGLTVAFLLVGRVGLAAAARQADARARAGAARRPDGIAAHR